MPMAVPLNNLGPLLAGEDMAAMADRSFRTYGEVQYGAAPFHSSDSAQDTLEQATGISITTAIIGSMLLDGGSDF